MKKILFLLPLSVFVLSSCKKEPARLKPSQEPLAEPLVAVYVPCNGFLTTETHIFKEASSKTYSQTNSHASFTKSLQTGPSFDNVKVESVSINDLSLSHWETGFQYYRYFLPEAKEINWKVTGANGIPSFQFVDARPAPSADYANLPDTVPKKETFYIILQIANISKGELYLGYDSLTGFQVSFPLGNGLNVYHLTTEQLSLIKQEKIRLSIDLENNAYEAIEEKTFRFSKRFNFVKELVLQ